MTITKQRKLEILDPVNIEPYKLVVYLVKGREEMEFLSTCENVNAVAWEEMCDTAVGITIPICDDNGCLSMVLLLNEEADLGTLLHECIHIIHFMMDDRGIPISVENTETEAYHVEALFNSILSRSVFPLLSTSSQA